MYQPWHLSVYSEHFPHRSIECRNRSLLITSGITKIMINLNVSILTSASESSTISSLFNRIFSSIDQWQFFSHIEKTDKPLYIHLMSVNVGQFSYRLIGHFRRQISTKYVIHWIFKLIDSIKFWEYAVQSMLSTTKFILRTHICWTFCDTPWGKRTSETWYPQVIAMLEKQSGRNLDRQISLELIMIGVFTSL